MAEEEFKEDTATQEVRDEEFDVAKAVEIVRNWTRKNVGSLTAHQFTVEDVRQNGSNTRYIVIVSVVPDLGEERDYYLIKVDVKTGKIVPPLGKGKKEKDGQIIIKKLSVEADPEFFD